MPSQLQSALVAALVDVLVHDLLLHAPGSVDADDGDDDVDVEARRRQQHDQEAA